MNSLFLQYGNNSDTIIACASKNPSTVLFNLHRELADSFASSPEALPDFQDETVPLDVLLATRSGLGKLGCYQLQPSNIPQLTQNSRVLIYWPQLIREAYDLVYTSIPLAMFFLSFSPIIKLRSPFLAEALHRNYAKCLYRILLPDHPELKQSVSTQVDVPELEAQTAQEMLKYLSKEPEFIRAMQQTCCDNYSKIKFNRERYKLGRERGPFPAECVTFSSFLYPARGKDCGNEFNLPSKYVLPHKFFASPDLPPILDEIYVAFHSAKVWDKPRGWQKRYVENQVRTLGVAILPAMPGGVLFINWEKWYSHRLNLRSVQVFRNVVRANPNYKKVAVHTATSQYSTILSDVIFSLYPSINVSPVAFAKSTQKLEEEWQNSFSPAFVTAINIRKLKDLRTRLRKMKESLRKSGARVKRTYAMERLDYTFPLLIGGEEVMCKAVHTGRKLWFIPPWNMDHAHIFLNPNIKGDAWSKNNLQRGVLQLEDTGSTAYDVKFLRNRELSPGTPSDPDILEQLDIIANTLNRADIKAAVATSDEKRKGHPLHFTEYQDDMIRRYFRPNMRTEDKEHLYKVCAKHNIVAISRRATILRRSLITKGVYNLDELPHGRYNYRIKLEIEKAQREDNDDE